MLFRSNRISRQEVMDILLPVLKIEFSMYLDKQGRFIESGKEQIQNAIAEKEKELKSIQAAAGRLETEEYYIYIDYRAGKTAQKEYVAQKKKKEEFRRELCSQEKKVKERLKAMEQVHSRYQKAVRSLAGLKSGNELTADMAGALIEKIYVYPGKRVEILFRYTNEMLEGVV